MSDYIRHFKPTRWSEKTACGRPLDHSWTIRSWQVECKSCARWMGLSGRERPCDILTDPRIDPSSEGAYA